MIRINAKSAPEEIQLMARVKSGFKNIEIQLINKEKSKYHFFSYIIFFFRYFFIY